jgi:multiple sugar transport system permease protein
MMKASIRQKKEDIAGYLFITPYLIGFFIFQGLPFLMAFVLGFTNIKYISNIGSAKFIGLGNFIRMFQDSSTMMALARSGLYTLMYVPLILIMGFVFALLINQKIYGRNIIRTLLFLPYVSNIIAVSAIFKSLLMPNGMVANILKAFGVTNFSPPLFNTTAALPTIVGVAVWAGMGLYMITFLAALQGVPRELLEAATIDGANPLRKVWSIIIPYLSPTTFFLLISALTTSLQNFTIIQNFTGGGPGDATTVLSVKIVQTAFTNYQTGYASAQAIIMFAIVMIITAIQWRGQKKWVSY